MDVQRQDRRRRMEPDARRAEILGVARRLFGAGGYTTVSISDIAAEAGVARALSTTTSVASGSFIWRWYDR